MGWKIFKNVIVRGTLKASKTKGIGQGGGGGGGCICITGTYIGNSSEEPPGETQQITDVVPEGYIIMHCIIYCRFEREGDFYVRRAEMNKDYPNGLIYWHVDGGNMSGGALDSNDLILNSPSRGFTVRGGHTNLQGKTYYYTVLAVPTT